MKSKIPVAAVCDRHRDRDRQHISDITWLALMALWLFLAAVLDWKDVLVHWFKWKRVCSWCVPPRRIGGSPVPLVGTTHTLCPDCSQKIKADKSNFQRSKPGDSNAPTVSAPTGRWEFTSANRKS